MSCKAYKNALTEAAASGAEPIDDLQIHLLKCSECQAAFTEAKSLFVAIDRGIGAGVNEQPSANFLALLRTSIFAEPAAGSFRFQNLPWRPVALSAGAVLIAIATIVMHRDREAAVPIQQTAIAHQASLPPQSAKSAPAQNIHKVMKRKQNEKIEKQVPDALAQSDAIPQKEEVIFSAEEQKNYRAMISTLQHKANRSIVVPLAPLSSENTPLEFKPVQIASLEINPLVRGDN